jgi:lipopolysaccharide biosynthesis protein
MKKKLAIFVHYSPKGIVYPYVKYYISKLYDHFDHILVVTNTQSVKTMDFSPKPVEMLVFKNEGYDFGMFYKALNSIDILQYETIGYFNDSNILFKDLFKTFDEGKKLNCDIWGITDSIEGVPGYKVKNTHHIQSHFLVFEKNAIPLLFTFFDSISFSDVFNADIPLRDLRLKVITECEMGITEFYTSKKFKVGSIFDCKTFISQHSDMKPNTNMHIFLWKELIENGYPFIKKKIVNNGFDPVYEPKSSLPSFEGWRPLVDRYMDNNAKSLKILDII